MVQFHAVALLHALRATDRLAVSKLVTQLTKASIKSPLAQCLLVRYVAQVSSGVRGEWGRVRQHARQGIDGQERLNADARIICNRGRRRLRRAAAPPRPP
jgi:hypothetical protein